MVARTPDTRSPTCRLIAAKTRLLAHEKGFMNLKKLVSSGALVAVASAAAVFGVSSPASAASDCANVAGSSSTGQNINLCAYTNFYDVSNVAVFGTVEFGSHATSATGCKLTAWDILYIAGEQQTYESPRATKDCNGALAN